MGFFLSFLPCTCALSFSARSRYCIHFARILSLALSLWASSGKIQHCVHIWCSHLLTFKYFANLCFVQKLFSKVGQNTLQGLSQELETGCLKLAIVKFLGVQIFKGDHSILNFNHKHVYIYQNKAIIWQWDNLIICLRLTYKEIPHKEFWASWGVLFKGLGVQKDTQTPCWLRPWHTVQVNLNKKALMG